MDDSNSIGKLNELMELMKLSSVDSVVRKQALEIITCLRYGTVPNKGVLKFSVGREQILNLIRQDLKQVENGHSRLRFLNGCYGSGKTHLLYILKEFAFKNNFASSFVTLTPRECPMYDLGVVYNHIVKGLRTSICLDNPALETIIKDWFNKISAMRTFDHKLVLQKIKKLSPDFQKVLTIYIESFKKDSWKITDSAIRWIQGDLRNKRDAKICGAESYACNETALDMLRNLVLMLKVIGFSGLVILLDEAEAIPCVSRVSQIQHAYDNLVKLINCNLEMSNSYFIYATTPPFFEEIKKDNSLDIEEKNLTNLGPLPKSDLQKLSFLIRNLHIQAYGWTNIERLFKGNLLRYVDKFLKLSEGGTSARNFVRAMVASLDICHENCRLNLLQTLNPVN